MFHDTLESSPHLWDPGSFRFHHLSSCFIMFHHVSSCFIRFHPKESGTIWYHPTSRNVQVIKWKGTKGRRAQIFSFLPVSQPTGRSGTSNNIQLDNPSCNMLQSVARNGPPVQSCDECHVLSCHVLPTRFRPTEPMLDMA